MRSNRQLKYFWGCKKESRIETRLPQIEIVCLIVCHGLGIEEQSDFKTTGSSWHFSFKSQYQCWKLKNKITKNKIGFFGQFQTDTKNVLRSFVRNHRSLLFYEFFEVGHKSDCKTAVNLPKNESSSPDGSVSKAIKCENFMTHAAHNPFVLIHLISLTHFTLRFTNTKSVRSHPVWLITKNKKNVWRGTYFVVPCVTSEKVLPTGLTTNRSNPSLRKVQTAVFENKLLSCGLRMLPL